jgi:uncharacterized protein (TIGR02217 family)
MSALVYPTLPGLAFEVNISPRWATSVQSAITGRETRIALMQYPLYDVELTYEFLRSSAVYPELQQLVAFFGSVQGSWDNWLWVNPDDYVISPAAQQGIGTGNGSQTAFQLVRAFGGLTEPVWSITDAQVYVNGTALTFGSQYTVNNNTGVATLATAPAAGAAVTWSGHFNYRCRFKDDTLQFAKFMSQLWENKKVAFVANLQGRFGNS